MRLVERATLKADFGTWTNFIPQELERVATLNGGLRLRGSSQKYSGRRNARCRVPFQRRHALAGRPSHLEGAVRRRRHDAPPVRKHSNAMTYDEATSSQKYSGRRNTRHPECPFSVATHSPVATSHTLSVVDDPDRRAARPETRQRRGPTNAHRSSQKYSGRRNARPRVPFQRRHAFAGRHVPDLERLVARRRHDPDTTRRPSGNTATPRPRP